MKTCAQCGEHKDFVAFRKYKPNPDGYAHCCNACCAKGRQRSTYNARRKSRYTLTRAQLGKSFSAVVHRARKKLQMSQQMLASAAGCSINTIYNVERAAYEPTRAVAVAIVKALRLPPEALLLP